LSRFGQCKCEFDPKIGKFRSKIGGRAPLDMMEAFKKYNTGAGQRESNGLKSVISDEELLGKCMNNNAQTCNITNNKCTGKCENYKSYAFTYEDLGPILQSVVDNKRYDDLIEYCKNDVIALQHIDDALNLYMFFENIRYICGNKIMDSLFNSVIIEMGLMHEGIKPMPRKIHREKTKEDQFDGALVIKPKNGIHKWVGTVDVNALYPNILVGFNISMDIDGITVQFVKKLMDMREHYRELKKQGIHGADILDATAKSIVNSVYGIIGSKAFRLFDRDKALFITSTGQDINRYIQELCKSRGFSIIYGDTDSVFISEVKSGSDALLIETFLNEKLEQWSHDHNCTTVIKLKAEKVFATLMFKPKATNRNDSSKKKYAGRLVWKEGKVLDELAYMGLELKRSDNSIATKECLQQFLEYALLKDDVQGAIKTVKTSYKNIKKGNVNPYDISLPKEVRKLDYDGKNSWVEGINYARSKYQHAIGEGIKPRLLYLKHGVICIDDTFDITLIKDDIDYVQMANTTIKKKLESYLWALDLDWNFVIKGQQDITKWF
jgi:DNA polymerase elongation subunit (family B)